MVRDDDDSPRKTRNADGLVMAFDGRPGAAGGRGRNANTLPSTRLRKIAFLLGVTVEHFRAPIPEVGRVAGAMNLDRVGQERRLLAAFGRIADPELRAQVVALAEALAPEPETE